MSSPVCKLSIVCPAYEEEDVLPAFHAELSAVLVPLGKDHDIEIIYVDDGSRDRTLEVLRRLAGTDPRVRYLSLSRNFGKEAALTAGLEQARGDAVITLDSDLQHPPSLITTLLRHWREGHEVVLTMRQDDPDLTPLKRITSRVFHKAMSWLSETDVRAAASDYRLLGRKALDSLLRMHEAHRFLRGMVCWLGYRTTTVTFQVAPRAGGVSKFTFRPLFNLAADGMLSFSKLPLRLSMLLGLLAGTVGIAYAGCAMLAGLLGAGGNWTLQFLVVTLYLLGGAILCSLGVVGEYVGRIYEQVKGRPIYLLKECSPPPQAQRGALDGEAGKPFRSRPTPGEANAA